MKMTISNDIYLYVLVRADLESLTGREHKRTGIVCAQVAHAANQCVFDIHHQSDPFLLAQLVAWEGDDGFGPSVVLEARSGVHMTTTVEHLRIAGHHTGVINDPSYPLRDGLFVHHISVDTCAYVFGSKTLLQPFLSLLPLLD